MELSSSNVLNTFNSNGDDMFSRLLKRKENAQTLIYLSEIHSTSPGTVESAFVSNSPKDANLSTDRFDLARQIFFRAHGETR